MAIGTFGSFTQARLAIYAAQTGLNVTGNNISNINTPGYTRQRVDQVSLYAAGSDRYYAEGDIRVGQGALVKSISQIRSPYLDIRYRTEMGNVGYTDSWLEGLKEIATVLDEVGKGDVSKGEDGFGVLGLDLKKLASALNDLVDQTGHQEYDDTVRQTAKNLISKFNTYAAKLEEVRQDNLKKLNSDLDEINGYLNTIRSLNEEIRKGDIHGDAGLELRDERNRQIDALSELIDINVTYEEEVISAGLKVERLVIKLDDANPDKSIETDESLLIDGVFSAQLSFGTPKPNENYTENLQPDDPAYQGKYLDKDGNPTDDLREAEILTDGDNPNYSVMISRLTNKNGDYYIGSKTYAAEGGIAGTALTGRKLADGVTDETVESLFKGGRMKASISEENKPGEGDKTVTIYIRTQNRNPDGTMTNPPTYSYSKQVIERLVTRPVALDDNDLHGRIQAHRELLTEEGEFTNLDVIANIDEGAGAKRGIPYYQKTLDLLANQFAMVMNEANQGFYMDPDGNYIEEGTNIRGETVGVPITITVNGNNVPVNKDWEKMSADAQAELKNLTGVTDQIMADNNLTGKDVTDAYLKGQTWQNGKFEPEDWQADGNAANVKGIFAGGVLFSNNPGNDDPSGITAANISISNTWDKTHLLVRSFTCPVDALEPASGQSDNLNHMKYLVGEQKFDYVPTSLDGNENASGKPMFNGTLFEMWNNIGTVRGEDQTYNETMLNTFYETALEIDTQRDAVSSVDFNDEAMNLMMYAKSYNAACRLMTTIDSVLDKLINNTGMTT